MISGVLPTELQVRAENLPLNKEHCIRLGEALFALETVHGSFGPIERFAVIFGHEPDILSKEYTRQFHSVQFSLARTLHRQGAVNPTPAEAADIFRRLKSESGIIDVNERGK